MHLRLVLSVPSLVGVLPAGLFVLTWRQQVNFGQSASQKKEQKDEKSVHEECQNPYCSWFTYVALDIIPLLYVYTYYIQYGNRNWYNASS